MANLKNSKKAVKVIAKKTSNNHELKTRVQNLIRNCDKQIAANNKDEANKLLKEVQIYADKAVSKGLLKQNTVNREKTRLTQKIKNMK